jgi:MurNAc alpha-1-phosphate uridylyltransferase
MILAAGRGSRLRPITDETPKPLMTIGGLTLIEWHVLSLKKAGISKVVINLAWLGHRIRETIGNGAHLGVHVVYSDEGQCGLETAGGVRFALDLLGDDPFLVLNGDIWTDYPLSRLVACAKECSDQKPAFLVSVPNPSHHTSGDFYVDVSRETWGEVSYSNDVSRETFTFSGMGLYHPSFFASVPYGSSSKLKALLEYHVNHHQVFSQVYRGAWFDIGTYDRLQNARDYMEHDKRHHRVETYIRG